MHPTANVPGLENRTDLLPELLAYEEPEAVSPTPSDSPRVAENATTDEDGGKERTRFSVPNYKPKAIPWNWQESEPEEKVETRSSSSQQARSASSGRKGDDDSIKVARDTYARSEDKEHEGHHGQRKARLAFLVANPKSPNPPFEWSRQTHVNARFRETSASTVNATAFTNDEFLHVARSYDKLADREEIIWDLTEAANPDANQTARHTAASVRWRYRASGSSPSALPSNYNLEITVWNQQFPSGKVTFARSEDMKLGRLKLHAALSCRDSGLWALKVTRNGASLGEDNFLIQDPPISDGAGWTRRVLGKDKTIAAPVVAYTNDEWLSHTEDYPIPDPDVDGKQQFEVVWHLFSPDPQYNKVTRHRSYLTLKSSYSSDGQTWAIVTRVFEPNYPSGRVFRQSSGTGRLPTLKVSYAKGLPIYGDWKFSEKTTGASAKTTTVSVRQIQISTKLNTAAPYLDNGKMIYRLKVETFPASWVPPNWNYRLDLANSQGQTVPMSTKIVPVSTVDIPSTTPAALARVKSSAVLNAPPPSISTFSTTTIPDSYTPSASGVRTSATRAAALAPAASTSSDGEFYTLAGSIAYGPGGASNYFGVDDNINVYVNDALVATSGVSGAGYKGPYTFQASYGDTLRLEAVDTYGGCHGIGPTTLYQGSESQVLDPDGVAEICAGFPAGEIFYNKSFKIHIGTPPATKDPDAEDKNVDPNDTSSTYPSCTCPCPPEGNTAQPSTLFKSPIPIIIKNGSGLYEHSFVDLAIETRGLPLVLSREYLSVQQKTAPQFGWKWSFQDELKIDSGTIFHETADGRVDAFISDGSGFTPARVEMTDKLTLIDARHYQLKTKSKIRMIYEVPESVDLLSDQPIRAVLKQTIDKNGNTNTYVWNAAGDRLIKMIGPDPRQFIRLDWSQDRGPDKAVDHTGRVVRYSYTRPCGGDELLAKVTQPGSKVYTHEYHTVLGESSHYQLLTISLNGVLQEKVVNGNDDQLGVIGEVTHRLGATLTYHRDASGPQPIATVTQTAPSGKARTWTYTLDSTDDVLSCLDPEGHTNSAAHDQNDDLSTTIDALGHQTTMLYDNHHNLISVTNGQQPPTLLKWDDDDNLTEVTDAAQKTTKFSYDANSNLKSVTDPADHTSSISYTIFGKPASVTNALGHTWIFTYDSLGFLKSKTAPPAAVGLPAAHWEYVVDTLGRRQETHDPLGRVVKLGYDQRDRLVETIIPAVTARFRQEALPSGRATAVYDNNDLLLETKALDGLITTYRYDSAHRLTSVKQPGTKLPTTLKYDAFENVISLTNSNGKTTFYEHDDLDRVSKMIYPGSEEAFSYDANSNLIKWSRGSYAVDYSYDALDRLYHISSPSTQDDITLSYDILDRVDSMTDNSGTTGYTYTKNCLLETMTRPGNKVLRYNYDPGDRLFQVVDPEGSTTDYGYSDRDEVESVTHDGKTVRYQHDILGRTTLTKMPNGVEARRIFSERDQLIHQEYVKSSNPLLTLKYGFNQVGQRIVGEQIDAAGSILKRFSYNDRRQLTGSTKDGPRRQHSESHYALDDNDNITNNNGTTFHSNAADQLTTAGAASLSYNSAGQATAVGPQSLTFSYNDQIKRITGPGLNAQYLYDGNGQRVRKTVNGTVQNFLWNGSDIAKEYKADGTVRADYQLGAGAKIDGKWQFYLSDIQGSTLGVTDDTGKVIATWDYDNYGVTTQTSGDQTDRVRLSRCPAKVQHSKFYVRSCGARIWNDVSALTRYPSKSTIIRANLNTRATACQGSHAGTWGHRIQGQLRVRVLYFQLKAHNAIA